MLTHINTYQHTCSQHVLKHINTPICNINNMYINDTDQTIELNYINTDLE